MKYKNSVTAVLLTVLIFSLAEKAHSQETMMNDFSYLYLEKLVAVAKENYPRVKTFGSRVTIAKSDVNSKRVSWLEPFSFSYYTRSNESTIDLVNPALLTGYQFGISVNPGSLFRKPFDIHAAKEQLKIAKLDEQEYLLTLETEVKSRYILYLQNLNNLRLQTKSVLDAENMYKDIKIKYEKGEVTFQDFSSASSSLNSAYQAKISAEAGVMNAKISLEELLVKKLEEIK